MAAIAGVLYPEFFPVTNAVKRALNLLEARSPEKPEIYLFKNLEMGARGNPIGFDDQKTISLVLDGEIQNQRELIQELKTAGYRTDGLSLPDLLVRAYERWKEGFAEHLRGTFAIALFDQKKRALLLVRDRLGVKPLYWAYHNNYLLFGSELKAIMATGLVPQSAAEDAIGAFFLLGYIPQDLSPIQHVNKLLPGHTLRLGAKGDLRIEPYWRYSEFLRSNLAMSPEEISHELDAKLQNAVKIHLPSEGELGYLATRSVGSAGVSHYLEKAGTDGRTNALSVAFSGEPGEPPPSPFHHQTYTLSPSDFLDKLAPLIWHLDEPCADPMALSFFHICQNAHPSALFSSVGYAEILAAHPRYHMETDEEREHPQLSKRIANLLVPLVRHFDKRGAFGLLRLANERPWLSDYVIQQALFSPSTINQMSPEISRVFDPDIFIQRFYDLSGLGDSPSSHLFLDTKTLLVDRLLLQYDRITSAHRLPWSSPFLDQDVVEFMAQVPERDKLAKNENERPLQRILPPQTYNSSALQSPRFLSSWIHDPAIQSAFRLLEQGTLVEAGWVSRRWLRSALQGKTTPPATFAQLWSILSLEVWFRLYINFQIESYPPDIPLIQLLQMG